MKDKDVMFDRSCHVLYSQKCKKEIMNKLARHYPADQIDEVFTAVQKQYSDYLKTFRTDLGGQANFHNGVAGTYDCIALFSYYVVCKDKTSVTEIEEMNNNLFLPPFRKLRFVNCNRPLMMKLMYKAFASAKTRCDKWNDYKMNIAPYLEGEPIRYEFTACPVAEFAKEHDLLHILPAMCNADFYAMELLHAKLVRKTTCGNGVVCDYTICGDKDAYLQKHKEYVDEDGYRRNE